MSQAIWMTTLLSTSEALPSSEAVLNEMRQTVGYQTLEYTTVAEEPAKFHVKTPHAELAMVLTEPKEECVSQYQLREACRRAWHWPEAAMSAVKAKRQIAVAVMPNTQELDTLDAALLLTAWTNAVLRCTPETAVVVWNASGMLHDPVEFQKHSKEINRQTLPIELWIEFRFFLHEDKTVSVGTWGMEAFDHPEMEVLHSRRDLKWLLHWLFNTAHFVLERGVQLDPEHTFGSSENEQFGIQLTASAEEMNRKGSRKVVRLDFDVPETH